ncbi:MAG TPA: hypothetical protein VMU83_21170 [Hanamia sp.]|nr:hypothetical protein [Hanamia sp.]
MKTIIFLLVFTAFIFEGCNSSTFKFEKNQSIDAATRHEIRILNDKLFVGFTKDSLAIIQSLMSPGLLGKFANDSNKMINLISSRDIDNYSILDEYDVQASATKINITLPSGNTGDNDFIFSYESPNKESYVSLLLLNNFGNQFLLAVVYGKYPDGWKINILKFGQYSFFGKNAPDYFRLAQANYKKGYLIDAVNNISLSDVLLWPAGPYWQYVKGNEFKEFGDSILQEANAKYKLPMTLESIKNKPKIFKVYQQVIKEGFFPMVWYLTNINLKDTVALRIENKSIRKEVDSLFTGIDKGKKYIFYFAFNKIPTGTKSKERYGFIDTLTKR